MLSIVWSSSATINNSKPKNLNINYFPPDTIDDSTDVLPYPIIEDPTNPFGNYNNTSPLYLQNPSNIKSEVEYDPNTNQYIFSQKAGSLEYRPSNYMTFEEYQEYDMDNSLKNYWKQRNGASSMETQSGIIPKIKFGGQTIENIFGSNTIDIRPQGSAELIFGVNSIKREDPALDVKQQKSTNFEFDMKIQMNVTAKIGDKIQLGLNYNTESTFDFENKMKLAYEGKEDEIIRLIEAGDVTMPLNSTLITGSQGLFGIKTQLQFGKTTVTSVFSQQKTQASTIEVSGGAQTNTFNLKADQYEENKHFFIAQYFRDHYNNALKELPIINSPINITKMEVWVTTIGAATGENRNIVALMDLGEHAPNNAVIFPQTPPGKDPNLPSNYNNSLYPNLMLNQTQIRDLNTASNYFPSATYASGQDYEVVESARKLSPSEYTFNSKLGFISMNTSLNSDHVLAVAYQYTVIGSDSVYQVGEFSTGGISAPKTLIVKLIKSSSLNTEIPLWKLMMKNVYAIGGYQVNPKDFRLNVLYTSNQSGVPMGFLTEGPISGQPLIRVLGCDRLNSLMDLDPDGVFDFIDGAAVYGGTIQATNGRIFFPVLEPFGKDLRAKLVDPALGDKYAFDELYKLTKSGAQQFPDKNKYALEGMFKSSSGSEISLNAMNVPQGSVKVTAGGIQLTENVDYTVDYTLGRVKIINEGILNSGTPIKISLESQSMFAIQSKTFLGTHIDYKVNKDFNIGATVLNLSERPLTQKINFGDEPINNTIWGMNADYQTESALITKLVDMLPFINTKAPSKFTIGGEFANLIPGHSKAIGAAGTSYIDDFEGTKSSMDIKNMGAWFLASTPQGQTSANMFPEGSSTDLGFGFNRAKLNWYVIDPLFLRNNSLTPSHITANDQSNHFVREILETEVFPAKESPTGQPTNIAVLDMAFYPSERGPYNYDVNPTSFSSGLNFSTGELNSPETRWGGMMRKIETTDFEATNVEYIEFWMMDPFVYDPLHSGGELYFDLGDISEDVLKDGRKSYENGLPTSTTITNVDTTIWGRVPTVQALVNSFDNNADARKYQDVGYDGLGDDDERTFFYNSYINNIPAGAAHDNAVADPSADNYHYFRGSDFDNASTSILDRYKKYNGLEGNSSVERPDDYPISSTTIPNAEDINRDNTLSKTERYFQYKVDLKPSKMVVGENYITDVLNANVTLANGTASSVKWYQFKIPISSPDKIVNNIQDFKSIRFMRTFFKGFSQPIICRFATLDLVRTDWRKYLSSLLAPGEYNPDDTQSQTVFEISAVNIEENGKRSPIPYVLPPDIIRETNVASTNLQQLNEQSLVLKVCNLIDGDARGAYKTSDLDIRQYKKIKMYIHAEAGRVDEALNKGDLTLFLRLGTDFNTNYYEYELPLSPTAWGTTTDKEIWPDANLIDLDLSQFQDIKLERNVAMRSGSTVTLLTPYNKMDGDRKVTVVGNPTLSGVKTIMIGIRNPKKTSVTNGDDGLAKCAEIWVNELRLTDFNEKGGWAATARITANLADLGTVALAGNISTPGFGSIEKKVNERQKENITQYDIATNLELGKFLPQKSGIKIPMHFDYSESFSNPQYNPLNPDILLNTDLDSYSNASQQDSIKKLVQDYTMRKSINFMNVKKEKTGTSTKSHIYDVENLDFTYAYTEVYHRNIDIEYDVKKTYKGAIGYNFSNNPKNFTPFGKSKFFGKYKSLRLIKDFNFFLMPKLLSFRTDVDRGYSESLMRDKSTAIVIIDPTYVKTFNWNRLYDLKWDLT
ncbi:MAG: cell surface protein SprA, partial [Bacteroidetes bacterium]|nr:cell surface protein SprA [Bacteroidota bacterium]